MKQNKPRLFAAAALIIAGVLLLCGCPPSGRPTHTVDICLASGLLAGPYCPAPSVTERKYYVDPEPGEPIPPADLCTVHAMPIPPDPPDPPPDPDVQVTVCAGSDLMPGEWCVNRKTITVKQSALPLGNCGIHSPPRLAVYVGALDLMGATGDWKAFLAKAKTAGAAGVRIFVCYSWQGPQPISPYIQVGTWTHPTTHETFPLYRLSAWNPAFWTKLSAVLLEMKRLKLHAWLVAEDYCSLKGDKHEKYFNPFYCSEEALHGTPGGIWGVPMRFHHAALYQKIIQTANASGCPFWIEAMNETSIVDGTDAEIIAWNKWANGTIVKYGLPIARIISSPSMSVAFDIAQQVGIFSPHQIGRPDVVQAIAGVNITKTLFSSDGFKQGTGPADAKGKRGVGLDVADALARKIISVGAVGYELFDRGIWRDNNNRANLDAFQPAVLERMTRGN